MSKTKKRTKNSPPAITIESDALRANLLETAQEVTIAPSYAVLLEIVANFKGIHKNLEGLLYEISHPYRNWGLIIPKLRAFVLKNIGHYLRHERGPEAFACFVAIFFETIAASKKKENLLSQTMEALLAYVEKLATLLDDVSLPRYQSVIADCFSMLCGLEDQVLIFMVQGHHPVKKIAARLLVVAGKESAARPAYDFEPVARLLQKILSFNYQYWLSEEDPLAWFSSQCEERPGSPCRGWEAGKLFNAISHQQMQEHLDRLAAVNVEADPRKAVECLLAMPAHMAFVRLYKEVAEKLGEASPADAGGPAVAGSPGATSGQGADRFAENRKLLFLFRIMETKGLALIHEETLREINRSLVQLVRRQSFEEIESFLLTAFRLLKVNVRKYPYTSLQCIQLLGTEVFNRSNSRLVEAFLWETVRFGFQYANVSGIDEDWQPIANPAHLTNVRVWINLIMQEPKWCSTLFSALIINLMLTGTCVKDTDLFQRDITGLLNHPIAPIYNLFKQFAKLMPVFFNEIGAEGVLRDVSTEIDEINNRKDLLIHFLRKQSHVESSNLIVNFIEAIFEFWKTRDKKLLVPFLPPEVLAEVSSNGPFVDDMHRLMGRIFTRPEIILVADILKWDDQQRHLFLSQQNDLPAAEIRRFALLADMYKLLHQKYNLGFQELRHQLQQAANMGFSKMESLLADLASCDTYQCLRALLKHLEDLHQIILSEEIFEAKEDIYHKRHIAADIPSVYGRYREKKFDALSLAFRLENLANIYFEKLPKTVNLSFITQATFIRIIKCIRLYLRALKLDGITSRRLETYVALLSSSLSIKRFSYTQYLDIFRGLSEGVKDVIYAYYTNVHQNNLSIIIPQIEAKNLQPKYLSLWDDKDVNGSILRLSEAFFRNLISGTFGLQHFDNFITQIILTLERQKDLLDENSLDLLMTYNPEKAISFLHDKNPFTNNLIHLGNKGYNLTLLAADNKPVPPGFIITTEIFRCWSVVKGFNKARDEFMRQVRESISRVEERTGRKYGDPKQPLLFSVRSGAAISMPGMMATIHNVGLNEEIVEGFASISGQESLAWDNYRRFLQSWAMTRGMDREKFQELMDAAKARHGVEVKRQFSPLQMKELALDYQKSIRSVGIGIPDDPWLQIIGAVEMVLDSWDAEKTREYRALMDVSDAWGTAVIVQAMVFGNLGPDSGSGVLFTAHPYRKVRRVALWGDYALSDQGEDIVSGLVTTNAVSVEQAGIDGRPPENTLERRFPAVYKTLLALARELVYDKHWNPQEIEFTFEGPRVEDVYILQTRDMITIKKQESFNVFIEDDSFERDLLGKGIGVSGSALSGRAVFTAENIDRLREEDPYTPLILIRQDTVPEDIKEIALAEGLLTARGGHTSHASVVATHLERTCVVGCKDLRVYETAQYCRIGGQTIRFGDAVSICGRRGLFLKGMHPIKEEAHILPI